MIERIEITINLIAVIARSEIGVFVSIIRKRCNNCISEAVIILTIFKAVFLVAFVFFNVIKLANSYIVINSCLSFLYYLIFVSLQNTHILN